MLMLIGDHEVIYNPQRIIRRATRLVPGLKAEIVLNAVQQHPPCGAEPLAVTAHKRSILMRISLLQPKITRGNIENNLMAVQRLVDQSKGQLLVLPEYALTGSLVLDLNADFRAWARNCAQAETRLRIPEGKYLLSNTLIELDGRLYNCCKLLPTQERYCKLFPDQTELNAGIQPGMEQRVFEALGKRFKVVICHDLPHMNEIPTPDLDFLLFIYHFTENNFSRVIEEIKAVSVERRLRVLASSLVSDMNDGFSSFVDGHVVVSLSNQTGILEVEIE